MTNPMMKISVWLTLLFSLTIISCKGENQRAKEQMIAQTINEMQADAATLAITQPTSSQNDADKIIGLWEVKTDYYMAVYEIEKYEGKYIGKIHYYNDGQTEYKGTNSKDDYFLEGIVFQNGVYENGKMYLPDGSYYNVMFTLKDDELTAKMTVKGEPYQEVWKRKKYK